MWSDRIIGNGSYLPFPLILSLSSQLRRRRASTALAVLALSAGVGLATIVELSTRSIAVPLETTTRALMGSAQLSVSAGDVGVPESLVEKIREVPGVRLASPIINRTFRVAGGVAEALPVRLIGIDLLQPSGVREFGVTQGGLKLRDPLRLLAAPNAVVVSEELATRLGAGEGDMIRLRSAGREDDFVVRGFLTGPLAEAFGGQIGLMDVFGLQEVLGFRGRFDRIDVVRAPSTSSDELVHGLQTVVGSTASVHPAQHREVYFEPVIATLRSGIWSIAGVGILLSLFLTYCVTSLTIDRRVEELLLLRTAGWPGSRVTLLVLVDTVLIAALATVVGCAFATLLADTLVAAFSRASTFLQQAEIPPTRVLPSTLFVAFLAGVPVALIAAASPAIRAGRGAPLAALRAHRAPPSRYSANPRLMAVGAIAAAVAVLAWAAPPDALEGNPRVALVIACSVVAVGLLMTQVLLLLYRPLQELLGCLFPRTGHVSLAAALQRPVETGATLAIWVAITASLVAMFSLVQSIVASFDDFWVGLQGADAVVAFGEAPVSYLDRDLITRENIEVIRSTEGVLAVAEFYNIEVIVRGEPVLLGSLAARVLVEQANGASAFWDHPDAAVAALLRSELSMNKAFSKRFGAKVGDDLLLTTDHGSRLFKVGAIDRSFAGSSGGLTLDIDTFNEWFEPPGADHVTFWTRGPPEPVLKRIHERVRSQALFFRLGEAETRAMAILVGQYTDLLLIPVLMIGSIGGIALASLLFGNVVSRRRDLAVLRASGASRRQVRAVVRLHGLLLGVSGTVTGTLLGVPWASVLADRVSAQLGYEAQVSIDLQATFAIAVGAIGVSVLAAGIAAVIGRAEQVRTGISEIS